MGQPTKTALCFCLLLLAVESPPRPQLVLSSSSARWLPRPCLHPAPRRRWLVAVIALPVPMLLPPPPLRGLRRLPLSGLLMDLLPNRLLAVVVLAAPRRRCLLGLPVLELLLLAVLVLSVRLRCPSLSPTLLPLPPLSLSWFSAPSPRRFCLCPSTLLPPPTPGSQRPSSRLKRSS